MKHYLTSSQISVILQTLEKIKAAAEKSPTIMAAIDICRHDILKCQAALNELKK